MADSGSAGIIRFEDDFHPNGDGGNCADEPVVPHSAEQVPAHLGQRVDVRGSELNIRAPEHPYLVPQPNTGDTHTLGDNVFDECDPFDPTILDSLANQNLGTIHQGYVLTQMSVFNAQYDPQPLNDRLGTAQDAPNATSLRLPQLTGQSEPFPESYYEQVWQMNGPMPQTTYTYQSDNTAEFPPSATHSRHGLVSASVQSAIPHGNNGQLQGQQIFQRQDGVDRLTEHAIGSMPNMGASQIPSNSGLGVPKPGHRVEAQPMPSHTGEAQPTALGPYMPTPNDTGRPMPKPSESGMVTLNPSVPPTTVNEGPNMLNGTLVTKQKT